VISPIILTSDFGVGVGEVKHFVPGLLVTVLAHVKLHLWLSGSQYLEEQDLAL